MDNFIPYMTMVYGYTYPQVVTELQPWTKIVAKMATLEEKTTFKAIRKVLILCLEVSRLMKIENRLEVWALGCHPARNYHVTYQT